MPPKTGDSSGDPFKCGSEVEVSFDEEGFRDSWYTATVVRHASKRGNKKPRLLVQFHTLNAADSKGQPTTKPLRETVDQVLLRPVPPRESERQFHVGEDVDAFHSDGWWEGVVMEVNEEDKIYSVFFRSSREQLPFEESELRIHREWVNGNWVPPMDDPAPIADQSVPMEVSDTTEDEAGPSEKK